MSQPSFKVNNVHATFLLGIKHLDLRALSQHPLAVNLTWPHKGDESRIYMSLHKPKAAVQIFATGSVVLTGCVSPEDTFEVSKKIVALVKRCLNANASLSAFSVNNVAADGTLGFRVQFRDVLDHYSSGLDVTYEPDRFPGLRWTIRKMTFSVFQNGNFTLTGAKTARVAYEAFVNLRQVAQGFTTDPILPLPDAPEFIDVIPSKDLTPSPPSEPSFAPGSTASEFHMDDLAGIDWL